MVEEAPPAARAKTLKKKSVPRDKKDGPRLSKLIVAAVAESKERKGVSLAALKKALAGQGVDVAKINKRINTAVTRLVSVGTLNQTKGIGACGSFKIAKKESKAVKPAKKAAAKKKKAPKAKKPAAKKATTPKRPVAKRSAAKRSPKKASVRKASRKVVKKSPKKSAARRPKSAKRAPARKPAARKARR
ncbi:histone H1-like [Anableps anableps]